MSEPKFSSAFSTQPPPNNSRGKRPASERRLQANRKNALRSTGPKTARGKRTVGRNAIKHGLFAREVVIADGNGKETLEEFHALAEQLWDYYEPVGIVEECLVQTIATCWWRKARVIRAENGEIRGRLDTLTVDRALRNLDKANFALCLTEMDVDSKFFSPDNQADANVSSMDRWSAMRDIQTDIRTHSSGLAYLTAILLKAKSDIESKGHISEIIRKKILLGFYFWDCLFALTCIKDGGPEPKVEEQQTAGTDEKQAGEERTNLTAFIDNRLERISALKEYALQREKLRVDSEARSNSLPPVDVAEKLIRYEAHLDRQLYRAMDQLDRLQRQRRGENVPPPVNVNLSRRD